MLGKAAIINQTKKWLTEIVIAHNLCPFAKREYELGRIRYDLCAATDIQGLLMHVMSQCALMDKDEAIETSLIIVPAALADFDDYLDVLALATSLMSAQGHDGIYQLASFHPNYCFDGAEKNDAANYTNRSPYPMFHILREASVEAALETYPNPENIPERNVASMRELGIEAMGEALDRCYE